ncbi:hypothetical protein C0580_01850 [Candidatus Parcubacteria bacterium]|nr:MAG: hypothetical protein C0580_01850 [Candidatus Parcubacteria bacterium]
MSKSKIFLLVSLIFLSANFIWLIYFDNQEYNPDFIFDKFYQFEAKVLDRDKKISGWNLLVEPKDLDNFSGKILLYTDLYPEYKQGDLISASAKVYKPEPIIDESGKSFAYDKYLAKDGIYATGYRPYIKRLGQERDFLFYIYQVKNYFWQNLNNYLVEPSSSLAKGMLLAARREIPDELRNDFARVGLSHIIAISGLHIAIIVWLIQSFLIFIGLNRKKSFIALLIILLLYLFLIAFPSSALRASLMVVFVLLGPFLGRNTPSVYSLVLVADIFVLINPYVLLYDIGFQLSFLAVLGLLFYVNFFKRVLVFIPERFKIREVFSVTLAAQVFTWPLIVYNFNIFSIAAPLVNFIILPILPLVLVFSFALAIFGFYSPIAQVISWPLFLILKFIAEVAKYFARIPYTYFQFDNFSLLYMCLSLAFMFLLTYVLKPLDYED